MPRQHTCHNHTSATRRKDTRRQFVWRRGMPPPPTRANWIHQPSQPSRTLARVSKASPNYSGRLRQHTCHNHTSAARRKDMRDDNLYDEDACHLHPPEQIGSTNPVDRVEHWPGLVRLHKITLAEWGSTRELPREKIPGMTIGISMMKRNATSTDQSQVDPPTQSTE